MTASTSPVSARGEFDTFADDYDVQLNAGLTASGEAKEYFARGRARWLARRLQALGMRPRSVLDFGCGTGSATPYLIEELGSERLMGVDVSAESLRVARSRYGSERVTFAPVRQFVPSGEADVAFCNGVFHHIPPAERAAAVTYVWRALRPGGVFAFWENNPWNPGTRYIMSRIAFDRNAITLSAPESRRLLRGGGFDVLRTDFLFVFPARLRALRWIEPFISRLPVGGQYLVLCRKVS